MAELESLKGIGHSSAAALRRLGIFSAEDLVTYYPREYELFEAPSPIYALTPGKVMSVKALLTQNASINRYNGRIIVNLYISDMTGRLQLSWFSAPYMKDSLRQGRHLVFRGRVSEKNGRIMMFQPKVYEADVYEEKYLGHYMPVYPLTKGVTNATVMKASAEALTLYARGSEFLPHDILSRYSLAPMDSALVRIHYPRNEEELCQARERIIFNEFFMSILAGARFSESVMRARSTHRLGPDLRMISFIASLPFKLTSDQMKAYKAVAADLRSDHVMNRLIEGDVGSGKTIVAVLALVQTALKGYQAVFMAPTAVLARQHFDTINFFIKSYNESDAQPLGLRTTLLTGAVSAAEKKKILADIRDHEADIIIGTHALFEEAVVYDDLGLIVTDEQHRFGVSQREAIFTKGDLPHTLVMSATPIPRTLSLILYNGMDISVIRERPEGRLPVKNALVGPDRRENAWRFIYNEVKKGHQAYVICPAIEAQEAQDETAAQLDPAMENVTDYLKKLKSFYAGRNVRLSMLHGRMKPEEKDAVMEAFKAHESDVLVSTTVVEVGVDVENASVMLVENADRFGLSELHQLRGRVGRGNAQSYCIFINTGESDTAAERLEILSSTNDGFRIAEEDLRLRGPGDIFGVRQSGEAAYRLADIFRDSLMLEKAGEAVKIIMEEDPELEKEEHLRLSAVLADYMKTGNIL